MPSKQEALQAIIDIVKNHQLSIQEVIAALTAALVSISGKSVHNIDDQPAKRSSWKANRL